MNETGDDATIRTRFSIPATHPSLPGHFPGQPVVPGVVLLDRVAAAIEDAGFRPMRRLLAVKFLAPLLPDQTVDLTVVQVGARWRFRIERDGTPILGGEGEVA
jgi:3-hydroxyacyl-[acyl-carrier-protein] dehydratase